MRQESGEFESREGVAIKKGREIRKKEKIADVAAPLFLGQYRKGVFAEGALRGGC